MADRPLHRMTEKQLYRENERLMAAKETVRTRQLAVNAELDRRDAERRAKALVEGMNEQQRDVLVKAVTAVAGASGKGA